MFVYKVSFVYIYHVGMQAFACHSTHVEVRNNYRVSAGPAWATWESFFQKKNKI